MLNVFRSVPLARLLLPFIAGIVSAAFAIEHFVVTEKTIVAISLALAGTFFAMRLTANVSHRRRWLYGIAVNFSMLCAGTLITLIHSHQLFNSSLAFHNGSGSWVFTVEETPVEKNRSYKLEGVAAASDSSGVGGKAIIYLGKSEDARQLMVGDRLLLHTKLQEIGTPGNPNEFNYSRYLRFNGILRQAYVPDGHWIQVDPISGFHPVRWLRNLRAHLLSELSETRFQPKERAVIAALTLGYKQELDAETTNSFAVAGAMHVLAVSGLHVGILYLLVNSLLGFLNRFKRGRIIRLILTVIILFGYAGLTGMSASVFRAATMFSFVAWGKSTKRTTNIYNTLAASALVLLLFNPYLIMQVGFQLSYAAVLGIVIIHPLLFNSLVVKNRILDWAWNITCVSVAAQIATFPLGLLYFHQFPNYFLFSNLIVIPMATVIMYTGLLFYTVSWVPILSGVVAFILNLLALFLNWAVGLIEILPFAITSEIDISVFETILIYTVILAMLAIIIRRTFFPIYMALGSIAVIMGLQIHESNLNENQELAMIYNVRNGFALDVIIGTDHTLILNESLMSDENSMLFHMKHHWWFRNLENPELVSIDSLAPDQRLISVLGNMVWILPKEIKSVPLVDLDHMVITSDSDLRSFRKLNTLQCENVILSSDLKSWQSKQWKEVLVEKGLSFFSVAESGPYYFTKKRPLIAEGPETL